MGGEHAPGVQHLDEGLGGDLEFQPVDVGGVHVEGGDEQATNEVVVGVLADLAEQLRDQPVDLAFTVGVACSRGIHGSACSSLGEGPP